MSGFSERFRDAVRLARDPRFAREWAWVGAGAFAWTLGALSVAAQAVTFDFKNTSDVIGWIALNNYPKEQEMFFYLLALAAVPLAFAAAGALWLACACEASRIFSEPVEDSLSHTAWAFLILLFMVPGAYHLSATPLSLFAWPAASAALCFVLNPARRRLSAYFPRAGAAYSRGAAAVTAAIAAGEDGPDAEAGPDPFLGARRTGSPTDVLSRTVRTINALSERVLLCRSAVARALPSDPLELRALRTRLYRFLVYGAAPLLLYLLLLDYNLLNVNIDLFHEGEFLAPLNEVLRGRTPFKDFYIQHGLFSNVTFPYIASKLFGATLEGWRFFLCLILPLGYVCIYFLALQMFKNPLTAALLIPIVHVTGLYRIERFSFGLIGVALAASYVARRRGWRLVLSGAATVLAFFHSTEIGLYALAAISLFLTALAALSIARAMDPHPVRTALRPLGLYAAGAAACLLPFLAYFAFNGALRDFAETIYKQCALQISIWGLQFPTYVFYRQTSEDSFFQFLKSDVFRCYLPILWFLIGEAYLVHQWILRRYSPSNLRFLLLWLWSIVFFRTALGRSDGPHILRGGMMMWLIWIFFLERAAYSLSRLSKKFSGGYDRPLALRCAGRAAFILFSLAYFLSVRDIWIVPPMDEQGFGHKGFYLTPDETERYSRTGLFLSGADREAALQMFGDEFLQEQKAHINDVAQFIRRNTAEDDAIFDFSNQGAYYFFADRPSATRYFQIVHAADRAMQREVVGDLEAKKPKIVIYQTRGMYDNIDHIPMPDRLPIIAEYLSKHYEPVENIRGTILLRPVARKRTDPAGRGAGAKVAADKKT